MEAQCIAEAERVLTTAIEFWNNNSNMNPGGNEIPISVAYNNLGNLYHNTGRIRESIDLYEKSFDIRKELNRQPHQSNKALHSLGAAYINLVSAYHNELMFKESEEKLTEAIPLFEDLVQSNPENIEFKHLLSVCYHYCGNVYAGLMRFDEADTQFISALDLAIAVADINPDAYDIWLAQCYLDFGNMLLKSNRYAEAEQKAKTALDIHKKLASRKTDFYAVSRANVYEFLAELYTQTKRFVEAEEALFSVLRICEEYKDSNPVFAEEIEEVNKLLDDCRKAQLPEAAAAQFTQEEQEIAMLLTEGSTKREIVRKLGITTVEYSRRVSAIRKKVSGMADSDPVVDAVADEFGLTRREADVLVYLRRGAGNDIITTELYLSEETVRAHVRNVLKKLTIENRQEVAKWLDSYSDK